MSSEAGVQIDAHLLAHEFQNFIEKRNKDIEELIMLAWDSPLRLIPPAEKRALMREKGIFVIADDQEFNYTIMEKTDCISRPYVVNDPPVELRWKNKPRKRNERTLDVRCAKECGRRGGDPRSGSSVWSGAPDLGILHGKAAVPTSKSDTAEPQAAADDDNEQSFSDSDYTDYDETSIIEANIPQCYTHASTKKHVTFKPTAKSNLRGYHTQYNFTHSKESMIEPKKKEYNLNHSKKPLREPKDKTFGISTQSNCTHSKDMKSDQTLSTESEVDMPPTVQLKSDSKDTRVPDPPKLHSWLDPKKSKEDGSQTSTPSSASQSISQTTVQNIKERKKMKAEVYGDLHYPHEDLKKVVLDLKSQKMRADKHDLSVLQCAKEIVETAARHDVIENALSKQSNGLVHKFFSGKAPLSQQVLEELDILLEKILDYMKKNLTKYTILYERKKNDIKREVLSLLLTDSRYLPKSWVTQYQEEEKKEKQRRDFIDWKKILLRYPRERAFDDREDVDGNFTRARGGHWLVNCLLGPNDSKTFEETNREKISKGIFLHKAIIKEAAKKQEANDRSKNLDSHKQSN
ncbi:unnamed protein product [Cylicocyclus nassatus]|uniref:Uncharacterized protein n=1 Tax=Cylicocyclus nassatus TaxID=53992 RepID=A0AA36GI38_CYLNA|nr:unnamed protein product [Cylicocyclus nassatus]